MCTVREAIAAIEVLSKYEKPIWISWTLKDTLSPTLRDGTRLGKAIKQLRKHKLVNHIEACMVNCCSPRTISKALKVIAESDWEVLTGGYGNAFASTTSVWL